MARIQGLATDPRPHGSEKLAGCSDRYRVRHGNYRIVYLVDDDAGEVTIFKIGDRRLSMSRLATRSSERAAPVAIMLGQGRFGEFEQFEVGQPGAGSARRGPVRA